MSTYQIVNADTSIQIYDGTLRAAIERLIAVDGTLLATAGDSTLIETDHIDHDIARLSEEAAEAGDEAQVALCAAALTGDDDARIECLLVIATAAAQGVA